MKRALGLIFLVIVCIVGFLSIGGTLPFMPIFGASMEPTFKSGALLMIEPVDARVIKVGDIIVYNVPGMVRDYYNYPPVVAHRVIEVKTAPVPGFRTKGDNTGEDPFTIRPQDIRGTVGSQIPYLGLPMLFFQSQQGVIFVIVALALLAFFLYGSELSRGGNLLHRVIFAPVINEEKRANHILTRKIDSTEKKIDSTEQALDRFSAAIAEYAQHLASHTSAIRGLSEASHELKSGAAEQNRVLTYLMENVIKPQTHLEETTPETRPSVTEKEKTVPEVDRVASGMEKSSLMRMKAAYELKQLLLTKEKPAHYTEKPAPTTREQGFPPGCARGSRELAARKIPKGHFS